MRLPLPADRRPWLAATAATAVVAPLLVLMPTASAAGTGSISGTVTSNGVPVAGVTVVPYVEQVDTNAWVALKGIKVETDEDGRYLLDDLGSPAYRLEVWAGEDTLGEFYEDAASVDDAESIDLSTDATRTGIDLDVPARPVIAGTVTDGAGTPVEGVRVTLLALDEFGDWLAADGHDPVHTDAAGRYELPRLDASTYRLEFIDDTGAHDPQYFDGAEDAWSATDVTVGADLSRTDVDVTLVGVGEPGVIRNRALPTIAGHPGVGGTLTAAPGRWAPGTGLEFDYQWSVGGTEVPGATDVTYVPVEADRHEPVTVEVTATRDGYTSGVAVSAPTAAVGSLPPVLNTAEPTVDGIAKVGRTLTAQHGTWSPDPAGYAYQWLVDGVAVEGETTEHYVLRPEDEGAVVRVLVTASAPEHSAGSMMSAATAPVGLGTLTSETPPVIEGTPEVGQRLDLVPGEWSPADTEVAYEWHVGGVVVEGATGTSYDPVEADVGKAVFVVVRATRTGYEPASRTTASTGPVTLPPLTMTAAPTVTGDPEVGGTLTATTGEWSPSDGLSFVYTWLAGAAVVAEGPEPTYSPTPADAGKVISVRVRAARAGHAPTSADSVPAGTVAAPPIANTAVPRVTGTPQVGQKLTAQPGSWTPTSPAPSLAYQWLVNGVAVSGQTAPTFVVPASALGKPVSVRVTASGPGQAPLAATSLATAKVKAGVLRVTKAPTVTGTARVGKTLTAKPGTVSPAATGATYQWLRNGKPIPRATKATYKLVATDKRKKISVVVTYVRTGYTTLKATSKPTAAVR